MANTERLKVIQQIRTAKKEANTARFDENLSDKTQGIMEKLFVQLDNLEDELILQEISDRVSELNTAAGKLRRLSGQMKRSADNISEFADRVGKVADGVKFLVDLSVKAVSVGLV